MCYVNNNLSKYGLEKTQDKVEFSAYSDDYKNSMIFGHTIDGNYYCKSRFDGTWDTVNLATKDDLTKSIDFRGNAKMFKVRSGTDGLKNIYLDIEDESGNTCSLAFLSDGENTVKLILNGKTVWTK